MCARSSDSSFSTVLWHRLRFSCFCFCSRRWKPSLSSFAAFSVSSASPRRFFSFFAAFFFDMPFSGLACCIIDETTKQLDISFAQLHMTDARTRLNCKIAATAVPICYCSKQ